MLSVNASFNILAIKQPSCKKWCNPMVKYIGWKSYEIQAGGQELAVVISWWRNLYNDTSDKFMLPHPRFSRNQQEIT